MKITLLPQVHTALSLLHAAGYQAYLVGGCVRDYLLGHAPEDFDIATDAPPETVAQLFAAYRIVETGLKHGTLTVIVDGLPLEITTFRAEGTYTDNRRPDSVRFIGDLREDLSRRDFTINAMAYNAEKGLVDPFDGEADIQNRLIRCVGDPSQRFREDALRILRAVRFASILGFSIEQETRTALLVNKALLRHISAERLTAELKKLLAGEAVEGVLTEYVDVLGVFIPELLALKDFDQSSRYHHLDTLRHTAAVVALTPAKPPRLRLAALLHDIAKPPTFSVGKNGQGHFYGHGKAGGKMTRDILKRLKLDRFTVARVSLLIHYHDATINPTEKAVKEWLQRLTPPVLEEWLLLRRADRMAHHPNYWDLETFDEVARIYRELIESGICINIKDLAISGDDLISLGVPPGPEIGRILNQLLKKVMDKEIENEHKALIEELKSIAAVR